MEQKLIFIVITTIIVAVLVAGGGTYWWQQSILKTEVNKLQQQISDLESQKNQAITEKNELQQRADELMEEKDELQQQIYELTKEPERYVKIISPNGGESICLNDEVVIEWESKEVDVVSLRIMKQAFSGTSYYYIGLNAVPATYNEAGIPGKGLTVWKVKVKDTPAGHGYRLEIMSAGATSQVRDTSDSVFSISLCEG